MRKTIAVLTALGAMTWALPALAVPPPADTSFTQGYDADNQNLVFGLSHDTEGDGCMIDGDYDYEVDAEGAVTYTEVTTTTLGDGGSMDDVRQTTGVEPTDEGEPLDEDAECELVAVDVTGPNGQVNHGQVVRSFVHALKQLGLRGNGCVVRTIAQSGWGKGDQQIRTSDVEDGESSTEDGSEDGAISGSVELESVLAACKWKDDDSDGENGNKPEHAGKPEKAEKPEKADKADDNGKPEHAAKPENKGNKGGNGNNGNGRGNGKP